MGILSKLLGPAAAGYVAKPEWVPLYPDAAFRVVPLGELDSYPEDDPGRPWTAAPASSHLKRFRFIDTATDRRQRLTNLSVLHVEFDNGTLYAYFFPPTAAGSAEGSAIFDAMRAADSPGTVANDRLVKPRVPYRRLV